MPVRLEMNGHASTLRQGSLCELAPAFSVGIKSGLFSWFFLFSIKTIFPGFTLIYTPSLSDTGVWLT